MPGSFCHSSAALKVKLKGNNTSVGAEIPQMQKFGRITCSHGNTCATCYFHFQLPLQMYSTLGCAMSTLSVATSRKSSSHHRASQTRLGKRFSSSVATSNSSSLFPPASSLLQQTATLAYRHLLLSVQNTSSSKAPSPSSQSQSLSRSQIWEWPCRHCDPGL